MRIAALILAHHKSDCLARLTRRLSTSLWSRYIHIDAKSDIACFDGACSGAHVLDDRLNLSWGGISIVRASLKLLRVALLDPANTHFYLMSGQCYPVKGDHDIESLVGQRSGNFISCAKMPLPHKPLNRITRYHAEGSSSTYVKTWLKLVNHVRPERKLSSLLPGIEPYAGAQWWLFNRCAASSILAFLENNNWYLRAFQHSLVPDEMFFQTLFVHLKFAADRNCPTMTKWADGMPHPVIVSPENYAELAGGWHILARKFDDFYPD